MIFRRSKLEEKICTIVFRRFNYPVKNVNLLKMVQKLIFSRISSLTNQSAVYENPCLRIFSWSGRLFSSSGMFWWCGSPCFLCFWNFRFHFLWLRNQFAQFRGHVTRKRKKEKVTECVIQMRILRAKKRKFFMSESWDLYFLLI